jgi:WD40 repeat protein
MPDLHHPEYKASRTFHDMIRILRIFVSSPSDVAAERQLLQKVINHLNTIAFINEQVILQLYAYEHNVPPSTGKAPQKIVDHYMPTPDQVDIFVCLFWNRMGTPFYDDATSQHYLSGTEYEFTVAYQASIQTQKPAILLYRCIRSTDSRNIDPTQFANMRAFFDRFSGDAPDFKGLYKSYSDLDELERLLFHDLSVIIRELINTQNLSLLAPIVPSLDQTKPITEAFNSTNFRQIRLHSLLRHHQKAITAICFASLKNQCISASRDRSLAFYDIEHQHLDFMLGNLSDTVQAIASHPTANLLAGVNQRGEVIIWNTLTYQREKTLQFGERYLTNVAFSPDGTLLCAISRKGLGWCWRTDTWELLRLVCQFNDAACSLAFSSDNLYLALACTNGSLIIWNRQDWTQLIQQTFRGEITVVQFIPGQPILALGFEHGEIQLWDYKRSLLLASLIHHRERITALIALHDGQVLFSCGNDQRLVVWDIANRTFLSEIETNQETPSTLALHHNETLLALGTTSGHILWYTVH